MANELRASIGEHTGVADALARATSEELDPLPSVLPPEGVVVTRLAALAARTDARIDVADVRGSADAAIIAALVRDPSAPPALVIAEDGEAARRLAGDVSFLLGRPRVEELDDQSDVLVLTMPESSPYADVNPDRRGAMARMATLAHLAVGRPWRVLVAPASALARKLVPPDALVAHTHRIVHEDELDRDRLVRDLADAGWLRVPVVEDPGTFAVRG